MHSRQRQRGAVALTVTLLVLLLCGEHVSDARDLAGKFAFMCHRQAHVRGQRDCSPIPQGAVALQLFVPVCNAGDAALRVPVYGVDFFSSVDGVNLGSMNVDERRVALFSCVTNKLYTPHPDVVTLDTFHTDARHLNRMCAQCMGIECMRDGVQRDVNLSNTVVLLYTIEGSYMSHLAPGEHVIGTEVVVVGGDGSTCANGVRNMFTDTHIVVSEEQAGPVEFKMYNHGWKRGFLERPTSDNREVGCTVLPDVVGGAMKMLGMVPKRVYEPRKVHYDELAINGTLNKTVQSNFKVVSDWRRPCGIVNMRSVNPYFFETDKPADSSAPVEYCFMSRMSRYTQFSRLPGGRRIRNKKELCERLGDQERRFPGEFTFNPECYNMPSMEAAALAAIDDGQVDERLWIYKPEEESLGRGIFVFDEPQDVSGYDGVIQEYMRDPLLIAGHKFDLRLYVVVTSIDPLRVYLHRDILVRLALHEYEDASGDAEKLDDIKMHLTNHAINNYDMTAEEFATYQRIGQYRNMGALRRTMDAEHGAGTFDRMWLDIGETIAKTIISFHASVRDAAGAFPSADASDTNNWYQMYGFDVMTNEKFETWLLEVNHSPDMWRSTVPDGTLIKGCVQEGIMQLMHRAPAADIEHVCNAERGMASGTQFERPIVFEGQHDTLAQFAERFNVDALIDATFTAAELEKIDGVGRTSMARMLKRSFTEMMHRGLFRPVVPMMMPLHDNADIPNGGGGGYAPALVEQYMSKSYLRYHTDDNGASTVTLFDRLLDAFVKQPDVLEALMQPPSEHVACIGAIDHDRVNGVYRDLPMETLGDMPTKSDREAPRMAYAARTDGELHPEAAAELRKRQSWWNWLWAFVSHDEL